MRRTPHFMIDDVDEVKRIVRASPWATVVANTAKGLIASHYPVILDETRDGISLLSHVGRPDDRALELGSGEILVIVQGPHGYVSPSWYGEGPGVPTWNHVTAHLYGVPQILSDEENWEALTQLVHHFEDGVAHPKLLEDNEEYGRSIVGGTVGFRLDVARFDARAKLSQNKPTQVVESVIGEFERGRDYPKPELAAEMRRVHGGDA